jgi:hypothetical protein
MSLLSWFQGFKAMITETVALIYSLLTHTDVEFIGACEVKESKAILIHWIDLDVDASEFVLFV